MSQIAVVKTVQQLRDKLQACRDAGQTVGVIPTMGALHAGHLSLARQSKQQCDISVATIFVNPTQFAAGEDLDQYPRTLAQDIAQLETEGVDFVFVPEPEEVYPAGFSTAVTPPAVAAKIEGEFRPSHFGGVCTVVLKLLNMVGPDKAFFGQKDYQQAAVIRQMVADLNVPAEIVVCPIVRDSDGLALSSRNRYLDDEQRVKALSLSRALEFARQEIQSGETDAHILMAEMRQQMIDAGVDSIDYAIVADVNTLEIVDQISGPVVVLLAAFVSSTRLIDNCVVE